MKKPPKCHLYSAEHEAKIPDFDSNKLVGYRATLCGYQRLNVALDPSRVNCKQCLKIMEEKHI